MLVRRLEDQNLVIRGLWFKILEHHTSPFTKFKGQQVINVRLILYFLCTISFTSIYKLPAGVTLSEVTRYLLFT